MRGPVAEDPRSSSIIVVEIDREVGGCQSRAAGGRLTNNPFGGQDRLLFGRDALRSLKRIVAVALGYGSIEGKDEDQP